MHPSIREAYKKGEHPLGDHPIHRVYGKDLAHETFDRDKNLYQKAHGTEEFNPMQMMQLLQNLMQKEAPHIPQLKQIAIDLVKNVWGITNQIKFEAKLGKEALEGFTISPGDIGDIEFTEIPEKKKPQFKEEVDKRHTMNSLIHGASIHQMATLHHMAKTELNQLEEDLVQMYDKVARAMVYSNWHMPMQLGGQAGQQGGESHVEFEEKETPTVKAAGIIFPVLVQELSKGVMEILSMHGLPKDPRVLEEVYEHADISTPEMERLHYFVGPALWQKFLKVISKNDLSKAIAKLSMKDPNELHRIIGLIVDHPEKAKELF